MSETVEQLPVEAQTFVPAEQNNPMALMALAVQKGADVGALEKLMDLKERIDQEEARKAFQRAKAKFQSECPPINKTKKADFPSKKTGGRVTYSFAPLPEIARAIAEPLMENGFTYRWQMDHGDKISCTCILTHEAGHSESNTMQAEPDDSGAKNDIQQIGSAATYLQRYTLIGVCGLTTADEDDDGQSSGATNVEAMRKHMTYVRELLPSILAIQNAIAEQDWQAAATAWDELTEEEKRGLWVAPSKGGIFTTKEREALKSNEIHAARKELRGDGE